MNATNFIFKTIHVLFWIIFIGLMVNTGSILVAGILRLVINPEKFKYLYTVIDYDKVLFYDRMAYSLFVACIVAVEGLKSYIAYLVITIFLKLDLNSPFQSSFAPVLTRISQLAFLAGLIAVVTTGLSNWFIGLGLIVPNKWGAEELLFFAGILYIVAVIFKKGTALQTDNDLTI
jgi:hypothetical protein